MFRLNVTLCVYIFEISEKPQLLRVLLLVAKHISFSAVLGVMAYCVDPGVVNTEITRHIYRPLAAMIKTFSFLLKTPSEGAYTTIYCTVTPESQMLTGGYYKSVHKYINIWMSQYHQPMQVTFPCSKWLQKPEGLFVHRQTVQAHGNFCATFPESQNRQAAQQTEQYKHHTELKEN